MKFKILVLSPTIGFNLVKQLKICYHFATTMVQLVEIIARASARSPETLGLAQDLKDVVEKHRGKSPDVLAGVTVYDRNDVRSYFHDSYIHDQDTGTFFNRATGVQTVLYDRLNTLLTILEMFQGTFRTVGELMHAGGGKSRGSVRKNVHDLRDIVEEDPKHPQLIIVKRGKGYMLIDKSKHFISVDGKKSK